jgi:hypothetical protein
MGDIADMMLDGTLCEQCGSYIDTRRHDGLDDDEPPGFTQTCKDCMKENRAADPKARYRKTGFGGYQLD